MSQTNKLYSENELKITINQMETQAVNFAYRFINDSNVRQAYMAQTKAMSVQLFEAYKSGALTPKQAAEAANQMRNEIMEFARVKSSDIGRAKASALKAKGLDLDDLTNKYSKSMFKKTFSELAESDRNKVYLEIVESSGRARPKVNAKAARLGNVGKGLWILTACIAVYNVSVADNKVKAAGREAANIGGGFGGGAAGGAVAGIWFGPVGVVIGVIVGGVLGAIVSDQVYVELAGADGDFARAFIPRFTNAVSTNEEGIANALVMECSYELDKVYAVFVELNDKYNTDADDIALLYVQKIKKLPHGPLKEAFSIHTVLRNYLVSLMDEGWTDSEERQCIQYLQSFS